MLSAKAGITHFHVGEEETRLRPLRELIDDYQIKPEWLYPTHVQRNAKLLGEAVELAKKGAHVDMDCVEQDIAKWLRFYMDHDGPLDRLTLSSDADSATPDVFYQQVRGLVVDHRHPLELVLGLVTRNPAKLLKLKRKGRIEPGCEADVLVLDAESLEIREVIARGRRMVVDGQLVFREQYLKKSKRAVAIIGDEAPDEAIRRMGEEAPDAGVTNTL
jgi:beta-aspartyl-dipeptidase (metallo-type)